MNGFAQRLVLTEAKGNSEMVYCAMENHPTVLDELKQEVGRKDFELQVTLMQSIGSK